MGVEKDSALKTGVIGSHGGSFFLGALLKGGLKGGPPKKFQFFFLPKVAQTPYPKSQTIRNHVSYAKIRVIIISARRGAPRPPPVGGRVKPSLIRFG